MKANLKRAILVSLLSADGLPFPESALISAVKVSLRPIDPTDGDIFEAMKDVEASGYVAGATDDIAGRSWTLTEKGVHKARQLR